MKIKSISLHGFKSFADRTEIDFHEGMTAIVGPNGCGKSNISDALRWVLGEQRPTVIRGSRMEEAIFQGTAQRKPIHRAEVTLTLANEDGILPVPYNEVVIGRTVLRGGDSVYTLNGRPCRLRDIQDLCRDTGLGANAYSIIEGRMVDAILSDRAEERRALFEEAAEVGRYKDRRRTALRRLDQAELDLKRLEDVLGEVRSKVRSLARQRGKARSYADLRERRLQLEVAVARARLLSLEERLDQVDRELAKHQKRRPEVEARLQSRETEAEAIRLKLLERDQQRARLAARLEEVRGRLEELERERLITSERVSSAQARTHTIRAEQAAIEERRTGLGADLDELAASIQSAKGRLDGLRAQSSALDTGVESLRVQRQQCEEREQSALAALADVIRELGTVRAEGEVRRVRNRARREELEARLAEREEAARRVEELEQVAGEAISTEREHGRQCEEAQARLDEAREAEGRHREELREVRDRLAALEGALTAADERRKGLAGLVSAGRDLPPAVVSLLKELGPSEGVLGPLTEFVDVPPSDTQAVEACLGSLLHAVVVRDWNAVLSVRYWRSGRKEEDALILLPVIPGPRGPVQAGGGLLDRVSFRGAGATWARALLAGIVSDGDDEFEPRDGPWVASDGSGQDRMGIVRLGRPGGGGFLVRRARLAELTQQVAELEKERSAGVKDLERRERELGSLSQERRAIEAEYEAALERHRRAFAEREGVGEKLERARASLGQLEERATQLERHLGEAEAGAGSDEEKLGQLKKQRTLAESQLAEERTAAVAAAAEWEREHAALQELRLGVARSEAALAGEEENRRRSAATAHELEERASRLGEELAEQHSAIESGRATMAGSEEELVGLLDNRRDLQDELRQLQESLDGQRRDLEERETELRAARQAEREESEGRHALELEMAQLRGQRATIRERLEAEWETGFEHLEESVEPPEEGDEQAWEQELEAVRVRLAGIGPVNLLAAQEYEDERERLDFLDDQKRDLERAKQDLHDSIHRINEAASASFTKVFEQVRDNFHRIFITLFEGGECDVWLADPGDPLDSPIEISASPRGKRTQRIHLLSGGERALTALALLFAIYLAKPSPFCVMDEVDAPLDESNIGRFTAMLEKFKAETQFIVITHNAKTIEAADWIYGVTMQEPGVSSLVGVELHDLPRGQVA